MAPRSSIFAEGKYGGRIGPGEYGSNRDRLERIPDERPRPKPTPRSDNDPARRDDEGRPRRDDEGTPNYNWSPRPPQPFSGMVWSVPQQKWIWPTEDSASGPFGGGEDEFPRRDDEDRPWRDNDPARRDTEFVRALKALKNTR